MLDGVIVFNKPQDFTSHDVIAKLRGILKMRKLGHAGTLDPMATGVLVVLCGAATKASDYLLAGEKRYRAGIRVGCVSDTLDIWGDVKSTGCELPGEPALREVIDSFRGGYEQTPPMYSAIQKDGVRLYDLARQGIEVERESRWIDISDIGLLSFDGQRGVFDVSCSKGTYIRTLCHDIGAKLGCGAVMDSLERLSSGSFDISQAVGFEELSALAAEGRVEEVLIPMEKIFAHLPRIVLNENGLKRALNGAFVDKKMISSGAVPEEDGTLCALHAPDGRLAVLSRSGRLDVDGRPALFYEKTFYTGDRQ